MFYDRFMKLCKENGVKPTPLVVSMGLSSSNVSIWKKGSTPRPAIVKKIADYFGVTTDYLLGGEQKEKPPTPKGEGLNDEQLEIMELYDALDPREQKLLLETARALAGLYKSRGAQ